VTKLTAGQCELCDSAGGDVLWQDDCCRVIAVADSGFPGFCRVILQSHVAEMTDLLPDIRDRLLKTVLATESALREIMSPHKINLACLGNMVPHLHWHVIPRFRDDSHFPDPVWATARRVSTKRPEPDRDRLVAHLRHVLG
jgi:diadenosine tetraphosphate (Ap4A) HIT family hydrolase